MPPPEAPAVEPGADADHVALIATCGGAEPAAYIVIVNTTLANLNSSAANEEAISGSIADSCGAWEAPSVYAHSGDVLNITQQVGSQISPPESVQVMLP
ncbi:MAG: hypothetical protein ABSC94_15560 [Polyangiaceae bacterium]